MTKFKGLKQSLYITKKVKNKSSLKQSLYITKKVKIGKLSSIDLTKDNLNLGLYKMC